MLHVAECDTLSIGRRLETIIETEVQSEILLRKSFSFRAHRHRDLQSDVINSR